MRKVGNNGAYALRSLDIMDHNIHCSYHGALKPQITVIRAWKIHKQRASIYRYINEKNVGIFNRWVK